MGQPGCAPVREPHESTPFVRSSTVMGPPAAAYLPRLGFRSRCCRAPFMCGVKMRGVRNTTGRSALLARRFPEQLPHLLQRFAFVLGAAGLRRPPRAFFVFDGIERDHVRLCRGQEGKGRRMASRC
jgi:hypothetical protein